MTRLLSGLVLAAAALAAIFFLPIAALRVIVLGIAMLATREFLGIARATGQGPTAVLVYLFVALAYWLISLPSPRTDVVLLAGLGVLLVDVLFRGRTLGEAAAGLAGGVYIGLPLGALVAVHALGGREAVLLLIATVVISDSAQYYSGRLLGRHPLAPRVSPKKTIEGAIGGVVFGTAVMVAGGAFVLPFARRPMLAAAGLAVVVLGICGDLFESRLKRAAGVKDSSAIIPGHGGVLDRIDALLFATPAFYLFLQHLM